MYRFVCSKFWAAVLFFTFLSAFIPLKVWAQVQTLSGVVRQLGQTAPVPFANVGLTGYNLGTVTNEKGEFELHIPPSITADSLQVSCIGFHTQTFPLAQLLQSRQVVIEITPRTYHLQTITILPDEPSAHTIVKHALQRIPVNYLTQSYLMDGFYREYFAENGSYVGFAEAAVSVFDPAGYTAHDDKIAETIKVNQLRVSDLYNKGNYVFYIDLAYALNHNLLRNAPYWQTYANQLKIETSFLQIDSITFYNNDLVYCLSFQLEGKKETTYKGRLFIRKTDYAVLRVELTVLQQQNKTRNDKGLPYLTQTTTTFADYEGKLYMNYAKAGHEVFYTDDNQQAYNLSFYSELFIHRITPMAVNPLPENRREKPISIFYLNRYRTYDPDFWRLYTQFEKSVHNQSIVADLERTRPLRQQYPANGKLKLQTPLHRAY